MLAASNRTASALALALLLITAATLVQADVPKGLSEKERQAAQERFLFGDPHFDAYHSPQQKNLKHTKHTPVAAAAAQRKSQLNQLGLLSAAQREKERTRQKTRVAEDDEDQDDDDANDADEDEWSARRKRIARRKAKATSNTLYSAIKWAMVFFGGYSIAAASKSYGATVYVVRPIGSFIGSAVSTVASSIYAGIKYVVLHSLRPFRILIIAPIAYLLLGLYHVFIEIPWGYVSFLAKELYPLYLFLGAATTVGLGLGLGAAIVLLAGSFVFRKDSDVEDREGNVKMEASTVSRGSKSRKAKGKMPSEPQARRRRRSLILEAMKEQKASRRDFDDEFDDEFENDLVQGGMWSEDDEFHAPSRRRADRKAQ